MVNIRNDYDLIPRKKYIKYLKVKLFIIIFIFIGAKINSEEIEMNAEGLEINSEEEREGIKMNYSYNLFKILNGFNISEDGFSYEFTGNLVNFNIMNENTGIGIDISPIRYFYSSQSNILSFANIFLYWDIFRIINPYNRTYSFGYDFHPELGPFFSINWINIDDIAPFNINKIIFSAGLKHSRGVRWLYEGRIRNNFTFMGIETGYRNFYGKHSFFFFLQLILLDYFLNQVIAF
jgi:hypothetical protein